MKCQRRRKTMRDPWVDRLDVDGLMFHNRGSLKKQGTHDVEIGRAPVGGLERLSGSFRVIEMGTSEAPRNFLRESVSCDTWECLPT